MIEALYPLASRWAAFFWQTAWDGLVVGVIVLALVPMLGRLPARWPSWLVTIGLLKFFTPPVWRAPVALVDEAAFRIRPEWSLGEHDVSVTVGLFCAYALGAAVCALRLVRRHRQLQEWRARAVPATSEEATADLTALAARFNMARVPDLLSSAEIEAPVALGVRRPAILLPLTLARQVSRAQLRIVLAHELVHHRDHDLLAEMVLSIVTVIWWFHPVVARLAGHIRALREERCDAIVVEANVTDRESYCRALLAVAAASLPSPAVAMRAAGHPLAVRFERLLRARRVNRIEHIAAAVLVLGFAALALPHSTWSKDRIAIRPDTTVRTITSTSVLETVIVR